MTRQDFQTACLWIALAGMVACGGCRKGDEERSPDESGAIPFAGQVLDISVPAGLDLPTAWELAVSEWSDLTQAESRLHEYALPEESSAYPKVIHEAAGDAESGAEIFVVPWSAVPELAAEGGLVEIPDELQAREQLDWLDVFPGLRSRVAIVSRKPVLVPISCPVLVCYYRADLLEEAGLSPPRTWSDYQELLDSLDDWAPGLTAVEPWGEGFRASLFLARCASIAKHPEQFSYAFALRTGEPLIDNPGFVEGLKMAKAALAQMPEEVKTYTPDDCRREILEGRAALAITYETNATANLNRGEELEVGFVPLPGTRRVYNTSVNEWVSFPESKLHRVTYAGFAGWAMGVSADLETATNRAAWEWVRYMTIDQLPMSYPPPAVSLTRESQMQQASQWTGEDITTGESELYAAAVAEAFRTDQLVMELPVIGQSRFRAALTQGLTQALTEEDEEAEILSAVAADWRKILQQLGQENVAKSYQRSHGLVVR